MLRRVNARLESFFPNSTRGKNRYITYTVLGVVVGISAYGIYKMAYSNLNNNNNNNNNNNDNDDDNNKNDNDDLNNIDLNNCNAIVTNGISNLGKEIICKLIKQGCTVFITYSESDKKKMDEAKKWILSKLDENFREKFSLKLILMPLDISNLNNIQQFVSSFLTLNQPLNFLINNHDLMPSSKYEENNYGIEKLSAYNYINTFYLTMLLTPKLIESSKNSPLKSRIINVTSSAFTMAPPNFHEWIKRHHEKKQGPNERDYNLQGWTTYGITKAALIIWAREYNRRYENEGVNCFCVNPGIIPPPLLENEKKKKEAEAAAASTLSSLLAYLKKLPLINKLYPEVKPIIPQGSSTIFRIICADNNEIKGGTYWSNCNESEDEIRWDLKPNCVRDDNKEVLLWELSEEIIRQTGLKLQ